MAQLPSFLKGIRPMSYQDEPNVFAPKPSATQQKITQIAKGNTPEPMKAKTEYSPDEFTQNVSAFIKDNPGIDDKEAFDIVSKHYMNRGYTVTGFDLKQEAMQPVKDDGILSKAKDVYTETLTDSAETLGGAFANIPNILGRVTGFFADIATPKEMEGLGDVLRNAGEEDQKAIQEIFNIDPDAFTTKSGEFGSEIATLFIPGGQAKLLAKFPQVSEKIVKLGKVVDNLGQNSPKVFNAIKSISNSSLKGATEMGKFGVVSEGEVTGEDLALGAIANPVIGTTIKGIGKITKPVAEKLQLMGLLNPAKLKIVSDQLKVNGVENVGVGEYLLKNNIKGTKEAIVSQLDDLATASTKQVDSAIGKVTGTFKDDSVNGVLKKIKKDFGDVPGQEKVVNRVNELFAKSTRGEGLSLTEVQEVKRLVDKHLNLFTVVGDPRAGAVKQGLVNLRQDIQKFIETKAKESGVSNIKQLNKNVQVNRTLIDAIERKESADQVRELLSAFAPSGLLGGIGGISAFAQGEDPLTILKSVIVGGAIGKAAGSTRFKTNVASILNKLTPAEKQGIQSFIDSEGLKPINTAIIDKIRDLTNNEE